MSIPDDREILIEGLRARVMDAHGRLNQVLRNAALADPDEVRKPMEYPCDPNNPMTHINGEYQTILSEIQELCLRLGQLGIEHI